MLSQGLGKPGERNPSRFFLAPFLETRQELVALGTTDSTRPLVVGNDVYDPAVFHSHLFRFSRKQYRFLNAYRLGVTLAEAAAKADMTPESAERFLAKPETVKWLEDRALMHHIKTEWEEPGKWWAMGDQVLEGERQFSKAQIEVWKDFGRRIAPAAPEPHGQVPKIEIYIDPTAVQEAARRKEVIEAELVKDRTHEV